MSRSLAAFAVLALAIPLVASAAPSEVSDIAAGHYVLDPRHGSVMAKVLHMGVSIYTVRFDVYDGSFDYDPAHPEATKVTASVDPTSLDVGADYAKDFAEEFLSASKFGKATFVSTSLQDQGGGHGTMTGDLTLMGVTKPVTFDVTFVGTGHEPLPLALSGQRAAGFSATTTFKRSDFGSTYLNNLVGDDITLDIEAEFDKKMTAAALASAPAPRRSTYSTVAIAFHWAIAILILSNIGLAWYFNTLKGPAEVAPLALHKSIGITVLLLTLGRIAWRLMNPAPPLPDHMSAWQKIAANAVHAVLYLLMLGLPLSGWAMVSSSPLIKVHPTVLFGVVPWPAMPFPGLSSDQLHDARHVFRTTHTLLGYIAYVTIVLHVAAALKHHLIDRDDVLARMLPHLRRKGAAA